MALRQFGKILRGKATPLQMRLACLLGALLGFVPGIGAGPGLFVALLLLLIVLNASLPLALLVFAVSRLVALLALPLSFAVGRWLLDGPTQGLFKSMINAPVLALFGFERYATSGGIVLGMLFGLVMGVLVTRAVKALRRRMAGVEAGSAAYKKLAGAWWARVLAWALVGGGHGKLSWAELADRGGRNPVRVPGLIFAGLVVAGVFVAQSALAGPLVTRVLRSALERANGATVDVESAAIDLGEGRFTVTGLALADRNALGTDLFRAARLEADVSTSDLLRRRFALDRVVVSEARHGAPRASPGVLLGPEPEPPDPPEAEGDERSLEDYVKDAEVWRERLQQVRDWLDGLAGDDRGEGGDGGDSDGDGVPDETLAERLEREAAASGYASVVASHLIEGAPTFAIGELLAEGLVSSALPDETLDVRASNLSTQPSLAAGAPRLQVDSRSGALKVDVGLGGLSSAPAANRVLFRLTGFPVDRIAGSLEVDGTPPLSGGTLDLVLDGNWSAGRVGWLDLPLTVALHDTTLQLGGKAQAVKAFTLPLGLRGPIDDPRISIDDDQLVQSLKAAGAAELSRRVDEKQDELKSEAEQKVQDKLDEAIDEKLGDKAKDALGGLLGGSKKKDG
jgi:uncharacterized protein (TIGR03546 family)